MEKAIKLLKDFFNDGWKYEYIEKDRLFISGIDMNSVLGFLRIYLQVKEDSYTVVVVLNSVAEEAHYAKVSEYLHRANYGLRNGNFDFDYRDGEVRYKTYVPFDGIELSNSIIEDSIFIPIFMFDKYGRNLIRAMLGDGDPEKLIEEVEAQAELETSQEEGEE